MSISSRSGSTGRLSNRRCARTPGLRARKAPVRGARTKRPNRQGLDIRSVPCSPLLPVAATDCASANADRMPAAAPANARPVSVRRRRRPARSKSGVPTSLSDRARKCAHRWHFHRQLHTAYLARHAARRLQGICRRRCLRHQQQGFERCRHCPPDAGRSSTGKPAYVLTEPGADFAGPHGKGMMEIIQRHWPASMVGQIHDTTAYGHGMQLPA